MLGSFLDSSSLVVRSSMVGLLFPRSFMSKGGAPGIGGGGMRVGVGLQGIAEVGENGCGWGGGGRGGIKPNGLEAAAAAANKPGYGN